MSVLVRATGIAVAAFTVATGAAFAESAPAGAGEIVSISSIDHAGIAPVAADIVSNDVADAPTDDAAVSGAVAQHALASAGPGVVTATDTDAIESDHGRPLAQLVSEYASSDVGDSELECLATAVYFESKSESLAGQLAVAEVIINRANSGRFPSTLCGVVKQAGQFSFVRGRRLPAVPRASRDWREAVAIAHIARQDLAAGAAPRALFFHARRVSPGWRLTKVASVGNHVFYR